MVLQGAGLEWFVLQPLANTINTRCGVRPVKKVASSIYLTPFVTHVAEARCLNSEPARTKSVMKMGLGSR